MSLCALALIGGSTVGPIIAGFINDALGYQWVFFIPTIFCGAVFVFLFLFMEETNYSRKTNALVQDVSSSESFTVESQETLDTKDVTQQNVAADSSQGSATPHQYKAKIFWQKMSLFDRPRTNNLWTITKNQVRFVTWPVVLFSGFMYGLNLVWTVVIGYTTSTILSAAPYNFS